MLCPGLLRQAACFSWSKSPSQVTLPRGAFSKHFPPPRRPTLAPGCAQKHTQSLKQRSGVDRPPEAPAVTCTGAQGGAPADIGQVVST